MSDETKTCGRQGCGKKLRSNNHSGVCGSGCLSDEAPPALRAKATKAAKPVAKAEPEGDVLETFRTVATALKRDPDELVRQFAQGWLDALAEQLEEAS